MKLKHLKGIFLTSNFMEQLLLLMWSTSRFLFRHWKQEKDWRWERKHDCKIFFLLKTLMGNRGSCQFAPLWSFRVESISRKLTARNSDCRKILQFFCKKRWKFLFWQRWFIKPLNKPPRNDFRVKCGFFVLMFYPSKVQQLFCIFTIRKIIDMER